MKDPTRHTQDILMIQQRRFRLEHLPTRHTLKQIVLSLLLPLFRLREIIERENALHLFRLLPTFSLSLYLR